MHGHGTYLLGNVADRSIWYYFPLALTMKLSVPFLILPLFMLLVRPRSLGNWACLMACALLALSVTYRVQIGIRLILPVIGLAAVGSAAAAVDVGRWLRARSAEWRTSGTLMSAVSCAFPILLTVGIGWTATAALVVWPNGLCYTNELWGGTRQGYLCLSDSNYDWGQGLKELARWQQQHGDKELAVWYFGSDPTLTCLPMRVLPFHTLAIKAPEEFLALVRGHHLAVSTSMLYGSFETTLRMNPSAREAYEQVCAILRGRRPMDRTMTYLIYDFTQGTAQDSRNGQTTRAHTIATNSPSASGLVKAQP
jgi:hypothetical protein